MKKIILLFISLIFLYAESVKLPLYTKFYSPKNKESMLLIGGVHGDENSGYLTLYYLAKNLKVYNSKINIYILPFSNINGKIYNTRSVKYDFNNKIGKKISSKDIDYSYIKQVRNILEKIKPKYVLSLHSGYSKTVGNKIVMDEKEYKGVKLYKFIYPIYKKLKKEIKNIGLYISHTTKNRFAYNQDNFNDLSWYCLSKYHSYFYTIESTKQKNIINQIIFHLKVIKNFFDYLGIKSNIDSLIDTKNIKDFFSFKNEYKKYLNQLKKSNIKYKIIDKYNIPIIIKHGKIFYYNLRKNKLLIYN